MSRYKNVYRLSVVVFILTLYSLVDADICIWCNPVLARNFLNCIKGKITKNQMFATVSASGLEDMKNSILAASNAIKNSNDERKMNMMNGAIAGEMAELIKSQSKFSYQNPDAITSEIIQIVAGCYVQTSGQSHVDFIAEFERTVDFILSKDRKSSITNSGISSYYTSNQYSQPLDASGSKHYPINQPFHFSNPNLALQRKVLKSSNLNSDAFILNKKSIPPNTKSQVFVVDDERNFASAETNNEFPAAPLDAESYYQKKIPGNDPLKATVVEDTADVDFILNKQYHQQNIAADSIAEQSQGNRRSNTYSPNQPTRLFNYPLISENSAVRSNTYFKNSENEEQNYDPVPQKNIAFENFAIAAALMNNKNNKQYLDPRQKFQQKDVEWKYLNKNIQRNKQNLPPLYRQDERYPNIINLDKDRTSPPAKPLRYNQIQHNPNTISAARDNNNPQSTLNNPTDFTAVVPEAQEPSSSSRENNVPVDSFMKNKAGDSNLDFNDDNVSSINNQRNAIPSKEIVSHPQTDTARKPLKISKISKSSKYRKINNVPSQEPLKGTFPSKAKDKSGQQQNLKPYDNDEIVRATIFREIIHNILLESAEFIKIYNIAISSKNASSLAYKIILSALNSCGYSQFSVEIANFCADLIGSIPEKSTPESYAEAFSQSLMSQFYTKGLIKGNAEDQAYLIATSILENLKDFTSKSNEVAATSLSPASYTSSQTKQNSTPRNFYSAITKSKKLSTSGKKSTDNPLPSTMNETQDAKNFYRGLYGYLVSSNYFKLIFNKETSKSEAGKWASEILINSLEEISDDQVANDIVNDCIRRISKIKSKFRTSVFAKIIAKSITNAFQDYDLILPNVSNAQGMNAAKNIEFCLINIVNDYKGQPSTASEVPTDLDPQNEESKSDLQNTFSMPNDNFHLRIATTPASFTPETKQNNGIENTNDDDDYVNKPANLNTDDYYPDTYHGDYNPNNSDNPIPQPTSGNNLYSKGQRNRPVDKNQKKIYNQKNLKETWLHEDPNDKQVPYQQSSSVGTSSNKNQHFNEPREVEPDVVIPNKQNRKEVPKHKTGKRKLRKTKIAITKSKNTKIDKKGNYADSSTNISEQGTFINYNANAQTQEPYDNQQILSVKSSSDSTTDTANKNSPKIKQSSLQSDTKHRIRTLMKQLVSRISNGNFDYNEFTNFLFTSAKLIQKKYTEWRPQKILIRLLIEAVVACIQLLEEISQKYFTFYNRLNNLKDELKFGLKLKQAIGTLANEKQDVFQDYEQIIKEFDWDEFSKPLLEKWNCLWQADFQTNQGSTNLPPQQHNTYFPEDQESKQQTIEQSNSDFLADTQQEKWTDFQRNQANVNLPPPQQNLYFPEKQENSQQTIDQSDLNIFDDMQQEDWNQEPQTNEENTHLFPEQQNMYAAEEEENIQESEGKINANTFLETQQIKWNREPGIPQQPNTAEDNSISWETNAEPYQMTSNQKSLVPENDREMIKAQEKKWDIASDTEPEFVNSPKQDPYVLEKFQNWKAAPEVDALYWDRYPYRQENIQQNTAQNNLDADQEYEQERWNSGSEIDQDFENWLPQQQSIFTPEENAAQQSDQFPWNSPISEQEKIQQNIAQYNIKMGIDPQQENWNSGFQMGQNPADLLPNQKNIYPSQRNSENWDVAPEPIQNLGNLPASRQGNWDPHAQADII